MQLSLGLNSILTARCKQCSTVFFLCAAWLSFTVNSCGFPMFTGPIVLSSWELRTDTSAPVVPLVQLSNKRMTAWPCPLSDKMNKLRLLLGSLVESVHRPCRRRSQTIWFENRHHRRWCPHTNADESGKSRPGSIASNCHRLGPTRTYIYLYAH